MINVFNYENNIYIIHTAHNYSNCVKLKVYNIKCKTILVFEKFKKIMITFDQFYIEFSFKIKHNKS